MSHGAEVAVTIAIVVLVLACALAPLFDNEGMDEPDKWENR